MHFYRDLVMPDAKDMAWSDLSDRRQKELIDKATKPYLKANERSRKPIRKTK